jgi:hypothetical protein
VKKAIAAVITELPATEWRHINRKSIENRIKAAARRHVDLPQSAVFVSLLCSLIFYIYCHAIDISPLCGWFLLTLINYLNNRYL